MEVRISRAIEGVIAQHIEDDFRISYTASLGGGCINRSYQIAGNERSYFVKINAPQQLDNFRAETQGLRQLAASATIRVPQPLFCGVEAGQALLIMEYLTLTPHRSAVADDLWRQMGCDLARLHATPISQINAALPPSPPTPSLLLPDNGFGGLISNSTLGDRPGFLGVAADWADFFCRYRLQFQFQQARQIHGTRFVDEAQTLTVARTLLSPPHHHPHPALTHGDLWAGNAGFAALSSDDALISNDALSSDDALLPVVFDAAPYVADGETDLALSELFGGFPPPFYEGYRRERPIDSGYTRRRTIYNLYHVLNHYNLFGGGYGGQAQAMMCEICGW